jgi:uncharacterized cupin superfamily protein
MSDRPISAESVPTKKGLTFYPEPYATLVKGRTRRKLGDFFGLSNFGVNLTTLDPGAVSAVLHYHKTQDEFVYVLDGSLTLITGEDEYQLESGDCMGFKAGTGLAHQLVNRSSKPATYIEIGDRSPNDEGGYPKDDLKAELAPDGSWIFMHKDGTPY